MYGILSSGLSGSESELLGEWLRLMRERSEARRKEKQLVIRGQEIELEHRHARLQAQLTDLMASSPGRALQSSLEITGFLGCSSFQSTAAVQYVFFTP